MTLDLTDLDLYDAAALEHALDGTFGVERVTGRARTIVAAELARRVAAEAARRRCPECWYEGGLHSRACAARSDDSAHADEIAQRYAGGAL